ncbi:ubiquitin carboxyl-terminal hydrolase 15 isoform X2 [Amaranthus tricolor]|uniref:ubiquitin carboxyl-terminal hydrolase 15 isoform X2 n=1 Tax=Amaranthus tricolor TaxID=29722 RepID=UPI002590E768|nr:ubiquitin carboxyl-terminal hydrolase 15 isoform X2 [Amaranthus tricolor]XP_057540280.1 ubiquitin carboxyl-terminal hydrolase 15 isoform X2 [Amaranthus tricolor]XP_057540281.1 ubiquitin carboxyl-terminal hydrolase 15 isoform X2 [Amaranthus tricolor]
MLEFRQADIPALFLVFVVLPVVLYILLGKWSEASRKKERVKFLVEEAFVEPFRSEAMAASSDIPTVVPRSTTAFWECARCSIPATTRCSRCKSVRYCSGRCQIVHWRQGHKEQCQPPDDNYSSFKPTSLAEVDSESSHKASIDAKREKRASQKRATRKSSKEAPDIKDREVSISADAYLSSNPESSNKAGTRHKLRGRDPTNSEDGFSEIHIINGSMSCDKYNEQRRALQQSSGVKSQTRESLSSSTRAMDLASGYNMPIREVASCREDLSKRKNISQMASTCESLVSKSAADPECVKLSESAKCIRKAARGHPHMEKVRKGLGVSGSTKAIGSMNLSKIARKVTSDINNDSHMKVKMLFPFEEFTKFFEIEVFDLRPRGLLNCGNSCYANAVLQCLTCTKPLVIYLLNRTHSRTCRLNNWCLMCELEQHVHMLRDNAGPLSPSRILSHIRSINCQMGDGSQEDAHEFLRLLVASMQSICLEEVGGEKQVHPILQETTFVQQTFGGRLRSLVVCLRCNHESERYENIMDLTLEIFGWVESLEDALAQFTTPEDLDGENMYKCGRCAAYVRARKQLCIDEAPNILTIVLKRFQEGNYGKINKCITFPDMLDMVPFMTGTNDSPPLYMLYGVVVHVDTLNASFSGHYVSYIKDLQGNWFSIDDTVVQPVPMSQVMSEGAYILFYMRSFPRPPRALMKNAKKPQAPKSSWSSVSKTNNSRKIGLDIHRANRVNQAMETYVDPEFMDFSDATTSDWSLFTSSDEASFTSESTRDSFSTVDYKDNSNIDPYSSMFGAHERSSQRMVSCSMFSGSKPVTRYISEEKGYILDSDHTVYPLDTMQVDGNRGQDSFPFYESFLSGSEYQNFVNYERTACDSFIQTFADVHLQ